PKVMGHSDPVRVQLITASSFAVTNPCCMTPSIAMSPLLPFQRALHPFVDEADDKDCKEHHHREEPGKPDVVQHGRPREEKGDLQVEEDEEDGDEVVAHVELHARVLERLEAALVGRELLRIRPARGEQLAQHHGRDADAEADQNEEQNGKVFCEHKSVVPTSRLELLRLFRPLAPQASASTNFATWAEPWIIS